MGGALGGLLGGGGAKGAGMGALGGLGGSAVGLDPAMISLLTAQLAEQGKGRESAEAQMNFRNDLLTGGLDSAQQIFDSKSPLREQGMGALADFFNSSGRGIFDTGGRPPGDLTGQIAGPGGTIMPGAGFPGAPPPSPLPSMPPPLSGPVPLPPGPSGPLPKTPLGPAQRQSGLPLIGPKGQKATDFAQILKDPAFASGLALAPPRPQAAPKRTIQ